MFDTLQCRLTSDEAGGIDFLESVPPTLTEVSRHEFASGDVWISGNLGNLKVTMNRWQLRIKGGSICKWWLGDNLKTLSRGDFKRAVEALGDALGGVPIERADVTRLDVGENLVVSHKPTSYYSNLGTMQRYQRLLQPSGLYYTQTTQSLVLYDKLREIKKDGGEIPELYERANVLRVEWRYLNHISKHLGERVTMATLTDKQVFSRLVDEWYNRYTSITKLNDKLINFIEMATKKDFYKLGTLALIEIAGGENELLQQIKDAQARGLTAKQAHDLRSAVKEATQKNGKLIVENEAIKELNAKMLTAYRLNR